MLDESPFERVIGSHRRPGFVLYPVSITWEAVAFTVSGERDAVACIPRRSLGAFFDDLDAGALDDAILSFLATAPSGRILRSSDQASAPGLFDELASPGAIVAGERRPGRPGFLGRGGGTPVGPRRDKRERAPRPRRALIAAGIATAVVAAVVIVVAVTQGGGDKPTAVAVAGVTTTAIAAPTSTVPVTTALGPCTQFDATGTWNIAQGVGLFTPIIALQQSGTDITGTMTLPDDQFQKSGWVQATNPLTGSLVGDHLTFHVVAPRQDGKRSEATYQGTVTPAGVTDGTAESVTGSDESTTSWSMTGSSTATCVSH